MKLVNENNMIVRYILEVSYKMTDDILQCKKHVFHSMIEAQTIFELLVKEFMTDDEYISSHIELCVKSYRMDRFKENSLGNIESHTMTVRHHSMFERKETHEGATQ